MENPDLTLMRKLYIHLDRYGSEPANSFHDLLGKYSQDEIEEHLEYMLRRGVLNMVSGFYEVNKLSSLSAIENSLFKGMNEPVKLTDEQRQHLSDIRERILKLKASMEFLDTELESTLTEIREANPDPKFNNSIRDLVSEAFQELPSAKEFLKYIAEMSRDDF